jgi:hypothetical protein
LILIMRTFLHSLLLLCAGAVTGILLIAWAGARYSHGLKSSTQVSRTEIGTGAVASAASPVAIPHPEFTPSKAPFAGEARGAQHITVVGTPPIPPISSAAMANRPKFQPNGLPIGVVKDAFNPEVYKKLPGVQPPIINYDGRDMSAEALSMMQTSREPMPMPGLAPQQQQAQGQPGAPVQPRPFPKTIEEINAGLNAPTPGQQ